MKRNLIVLMALVAISGVGCATGGVLGPNYIGPAPLPGPVGQAMAGNLGLTCPGDVYIGPPVNSCSRHLQYQYGYGQPLGYYAGLGYPLFYNGIQLSDSTKAAIWCGAGASGLSMLLKASLGRTIGAGIVSAAACKLWLSRRGQAAQQQSSQVYPAATQQQSGLMPVDYQSPGQVQGFNQAEQDCRRSGMMKVINESGISVDVRYADGGTFVTLPLPSGQNWACLPRASYRVWGAMFNRNSPKQILSTETVEMVLSRGESGDVMIVNAPTPSGR